MLLQSFLQTSKKSSVTEVGTLGQIVKELPEGTTIKIASKSILFRYSNGEQKHLVISKSSRGLMPQRDWVLISFKHETLGPMSRICKPADLLDGSYLFEE